MGNVLTVIKLQIILNSHLQIQNTKEFNNILINRITKKYSNFIFNYTLKNPYRNTQLSPYKKNVHIKVTISFTVENFMIAVPIFPKECTKCTKHPEEYFK